MRRWGVILYVVLLGLVLTGCCDFCKIGLSIQLPSIVIGPRDPSLLWNTFLGSSVSEEGWGITADKYGYIYVTGWSGATWGSPVDDYAGGDRDAFVAKLSPHGDLIWNTFLGSGSRDESKKAIAVDADGNVYVAGSSRATWGSPVNAYTGNLDAFVVKLDRDGSVQWNTFLGTAGQNDHGYGIVVDAAGDVYVCGQSGSQWGAPVVWHSGGTDAFLAKVDSSGELKWNTFMGSSSDDSATDVHLMGDSLFVAGSSAAEWGSPVRGSAGDTDAFVAKFDVSGNLDWNTFLGSDDFDLPYGICADSSGNSFVTGYSLDEWGDPIRRYSSDADAFVAKLSSSGELLWNTFLGGALYDQGRDVAMSNGSLFVTGYVDSAPAGSNGDGFVAYLRSTGVVVWEYSMGSAGSDVCLGVTASGGQAYVVGYSDGSWGDPIRTYSGSWDAFVAQVGR